MPSDQHIRQNSFKNLLLYPAVSNRIMKKVYYIIDNIQTAIGNHQQIRFQYYEYRVHYRMQQIAQNLYRKVKKVLILILSK